MCMPVTGCFNPRVSDVLICVCAHRWCFGVMGHELGKRVRSIMLKNMLSQEIGWFDQEQNSSGILATKLSSDAAYVRGAAADTVSLILQNLATLATGYIIAFV